MAVECSERAALKHASLGRVWIGSKTPIPKPTPSCSSPSSSAAPICWPSSPRFFRTRGLVCKIKSISIHVYTTSIQKVLPLNFLIKFGWNDLVREKVYQLYKISWKNFQSRKIKLFVHFFCVSNLTFLLCECVFLSSISISLIRSVWPYGESSERRDRTSLHRQLARMPGRRRNSPRRRHSPSYLRRRSSSGRHLRRFRLLEEQHDEDRKPVLEAVDSRRNKRRWPEFPAREVPGSYGVV